MISSNSSLSDTKLLELAAKAAAIEYYNASTRMCLVGEAPEKWDPLVDDGDALRLAVHLRITPRFVWTSKRIEQIRITVDGGVGERLVEVVENTNGDECAAVRRAIVRASAMVGERLTPRSVQVLQERIRQLEVELEDAKSTIVVVNYGDRTNSK